MSYWMFSWGSKYCCTFSLSVCILLLLLFDIYSLTECRHNQSTLGNKSRFILPSSCLFLLWFYLTFMSGICTSLSVVLFLLASHFCSRSHFSCCCSSVISHFLNIVRHVFPSVYPCFYDCSIYEESQTKEVKCIFFSAIVIFFYVSNFHFLEGIFCCESVLLCCQGLNTV